VISFIGIVIALVVAIIPFIDIFKARIISSGIIKDDFAIAALQANGSWSLWEGTVSLFLFIGIFLLIKYSRKNANIIFSFYAFSVAFVLAVVLFYTPKIERYSQNAAIQFCEKLAGKPVYLETIEFKSYAIYYYFDKPKPLAPVNRLPLWQLSGKLDKDAYFIIKNTSKESYMKLYPNLKYLYEKNGFVFLQRLKAE